ncbi:MAG: MlaD family protein [Mycobacteriaceae bacterium]
MYQDLSGRGPSKKALFIRGIGLIAIFSLLSTVLWARYTGKLDEKIEVTAELPNISDGLQPKADVKYRGVIVGSVSSVLNNGKNNKVRISLKSGMIDQIPQQVRARVIPGNVFGVAAIEFLGNGTTKLVEGSVIQADTSEEAVALQTATTTLAHIFRSIDPRKASSMLSVIATTLEGRGSKIGEITTQLNAYLEAIDNEIPNLTVDLERFENAIKSMSTSAPEIIDALQQTLSTSTMIAEKSNQISELLTTAGAAFEATTGALKPNLQGGINLIRNLNITVTALNSSAESISPAIDSARYIAEKTKGSWGASPNGTFIADAHLSLTPFRQYTAEDCPRYGEMSGPNCVNATAKKSESSFRGGNLGGIGSSSERKILNLLLNQQITALQALQLGPTLRGKTLLLSKDEGK